MAVLWVLWASHVVVVVKTLSANVEMWRWSLGWGDALEEGMATHSTVLVWRIPWTERLAGYSPRGHRVRHNWSNLACKHGYYGYGYILSFLLFLLVLYKKMSTQTSLSKKENLLKGYGNDSWIPGRMLSCPQGTEEPPSSPIILSSQLIIFFFGLSLCHSDRKQLLTTPGGQYATT